MMDGDFSTLKVAGDEMRNRLFVVNPPNDAATGSYKRTLLPGLEIAELKCSRVL